MKTMKKNREKDLFSLDNQSLDPFALPGKPEQSAMLPTNASKQLKKTKVTRKLKVTEVSHEDPLSSAVLDKKDAPAVSEFHFLAGAMGMTQDGGDDEEKVILADALLEEAVDA